MCSRKRSLNMPKKSELVYFGTLLDAAREARDAAAEVTKQEFDSNRWIRLGLTYLVQSVGEAASRVPQPLRDQHPEIDWPRIIGMRHRIVHEYTRVDIEKVWAVVQDELPLLIAQLLEFTPSDPV